MEALTSVMLDLWYEHGEIGRGYTEENYRGIVKRYITDSNAYFSKYVDGVEDLKEELAQELNKVGCVLIQKASENELEQLGIRSMPNGEAKEIIRIAEDSEAAQKLMIGEVMLEVSTQETVKLKVSRRGVVRDVELEKTDEHFSFYEVGFVENASEEQLKLRNKWLGLK